MKLKLGKIIATVLTRIKLPDTPTGRAVQTVGAIAAVGGGAAAGVGLFELTGDRITDIVIVLATAAVIIFGGKYQIPDEEKTNLP